MRSACTAISVTLLVQAATRLECLAAPCEPEVAAARHGAPLLPEARPKQYPGGHTRQALVPGDVTTDERDEGDTMAKIRVLSPAGELRARVLQAPPLPDLRGKTVGFIDNRKTNFDTLVDIMGKALREQYGVAQVIHRQKAHAAVGATPEVLAEMARTCDLVITGSGD